MLIFSSEIVRKMREAIVNASPLSDEEKRLVLEKMDSGVLHNFIVKQLCRIAEDVRIGVTNECVVIAEKEISSVLRILGWKDR